MTRRSWRLGEHGRNWRWLHGSNSLHGEIAYGANVGLATSIKNTEALSAVAQMKGTETMENRTNRVGAEITRLLLECSPVEAIPGWETRLFLITYPPGTDGSGHSHPVVGLGYVLEGTMITAFDDDPEETITAGHSFQDKASVHRVSKNGSATEPLRFLIAYTVKTGEPNTVMPTT